MSINRMLLTVVLLGSCAPALAQTTIPASEADWILEGDQATSTFGIHVSSAGDVDGDGYDDVLIGDASYDGQFVDGGRVTLYLGSANGLSPVPAWSLQGSAAGANMSEAFAAGDVNGDGFGDVLVNDTARGMFRLFTGSPAGLDPTSWLYAGLEVGSGDIDGDGFGDLVVRTRVENPSGDQFFIDVFRGSAAGVDPRPSESLVLPKNAWDGVLLDGPAVQDVNGDGYADLAYTSRSCGTNRCVFETGEVSIHWGSYGRLRKHPDKIADFTEASPFVAGAGDVDGDGYGDLAVTLGATAGSPSRPWEVLLIYGSRSRGGMTFESIFQTYQDLVTPEIGGGGDLNGDGFSELLVPQYEYDALTGYHHIVAVFSGSANGLSQSASTIIEAEQPGRFPASAAPAGDVNGDGFDDLIVGAPCFDSGGSRVGRVYVFHGQPSF